MAFIIGMERYGTKAHVEKGWTALEYDEKQLFKRAEREPIEDGRVRELCVKARENAQRLWREDKERKRARATATAGDKE